jgi:uncharacterized membrane protein YphA (DoxX/SURF4 family)
MNTVIWIAQILLAGVFLYAGFSSLFSQDRQAHLLRIRSLGVNNGLPQGWAAVIDVIEIIGALCLLAPIDIWPQYILIRIAATGLALLMIAVGIYHARRREPATPAVTLFMVALLVIVGRWP